MQITEKDSALARLGFQSLGGNRSGAKRRKSKNLRLVIKTEAGGEIELPPPAVEALTTVLEHLSKGEEVSVSAKPAELSTQQAADFLRVSRPFLINLLETGKIPFRKVGSHRRVSFSDVQKFKEATDAKRLEALEKLTAQAQELGMGY